MNNTMKDILEMHGKISNDPWSTARRLKDQHLRDVKFIEDEERKKFADDWYTKSNASNNMERFLILQQQECEMLKNLQQNDCYQKVRINNESLENTMGKYLEKEKNEDLYRDRYSQYLRENDPTLRKLASQLREAHVNKIRLAQIDEKERNKSAIDIADVPYVRAAQEKLREDQEKEKLELYKEEERKHKLKKLLKQQIEEKAQGIELKKTLEDDKLRIQAIVKANMAEIAAEQEKEWEKKMALRKSYDETLKEKEAELIRQKQHLIDEENRLKAYTEFRDSRKGELMRLKKLREDNLNDVQRRLGDLLNKKQRDILDFEEARQDVAIAESEMQAFRFEQIEKETKEKAKRAYIAELDKCMESNQQSILEEKLKEQAILMDIERVNLLKVDIERERQKKQHEKDQIFKNECQADIDFKRLEKIRCLDEEKEQQRLSNEDDEKYKKDVENERITMIKEMAPHLYPGCIPRGMLREDEIKYLNDPLKNFLLNKTSYPDPNLN